MRGFGFALGLVLACGEGTARRPDDACDATRAELQQQLDRLIGDQNVAAGTPACGETGVASGTASFAPALTPEAVAQLTSYFASRCDALASCE